MADDDIREGEPEQPRKKKAPQSDDDHDDEPRRRNIQRTDHGDGGVGAVIPYRNGMALTSYYLGVFGLISCFLGPLAVFGLVPLILGILGFMKARRDPEARGTAHALVGIILGTLEILTGCGFIGFFIFMAATDGGRK